jgi:hypothetical protein
MPPRCLFYINLANAACAGSMRLSRAQAHEIENTDQIGCRHDSLGFMKFDRRTNIQGVCALRQG